MKKIKKVKVKYFGNWEEAWQVKVKDVKELMYLRDGETVPEFEQVFDEVVITSDDHRPKDPPGGTE